MAKFLVTNQCHGDRGFNTDRGHHLVVPGESVEVDVIDPKNVVYKGWVEAGEIVMMAVRATRPVKDEDGDGKPDEKRS